MDITFRREDDGVQGGWFTDDPAGGEGAYLAEITYRWNGVHLDIVHTGVREALRGQDVARRLVQTVIDAARAEGFKIIPTCPYARKVFRRDPSLHDVLAPGVVEGLAE
jgi:predicted GNAT family acetyltransferase